MVQRDLFAPAEDSTRKPASERGTEKGLGREIDPEVARQVNRRVYELAIVFVEVVGEERPAAFLCECGCGEFLQLLASDYDAGGWALLPGHAAVV